VIHVDEQPEPTDFDSQIRQPGLKAIADGKNPLPDYWRRCLDDLMDRYDNICSYVCTYIPPVTGGRSVEHFAPKSKQPNLAYEWPNYRLICSVMNSRKNIFEDVIDSFDDIDDWFEIELTFMKVFPSKSLEDDQKVKVEDTIRRLKLNNQDCLEARNEYYQEYRATKDPLPFRLLKKWSPFVAREVERQGLRRDDD
jgi:uncharacterized protein (TIGR02646 family)